MANKGGGDMTRMYKVSYSLPGGGNIKIYFTNNWRKSKKGLGQISNFMKLYTPVDMKLMETTQKLF